MSDAPARMAGAAPGVPGDSDIVAPISAVVHEPFVEAWRRYEEEVWDPVRRTLEEAGAAHRRALAAMAGQGPEDANAGAAERDASEALARYRELVSEEVIEPLRVALAGRASATALEESLASTANRTRASLVELSPVLQAPASRAPAARVSGVGTIRAIKRAAARVLGPVVSRGRVRRVAVARLARQHLDQMVLRAQATAFRRSQHDRGEWLGRLERAWADWAAAVLQPAVPAEESPPPSDPASEEERPHDTETHRAAGAALQAELQALIEQAERAAGSAWSVDFGQLKEALAASVAVAGTLAADPPSSRPGPGRQRELAVQWDAWVEGAAARLELYRGLVSMRRDIEGILGELRGDWSRTVRKADAALAEVAAELGRSRERAAGLSTGDEDLASILEAERQRTDGALEQLQGVLPEPGAMFERLTSTVEDAIHGLDEVRERMPGALALHDIPAPGDTPRKPTADPRTVRPRETFLHAFDLLRRERMRAAPSAIGEAMHRIRSEVAELREVSGYGYEAAIAEAKDRRDPAAPHPAVLVVNGLTRAGNKAANARELVREAQSAAERRVAAEIASGSRQLIEQVTADRMTAGYLEARTYLSARLLRGWKLWKRISAKVWAAVSGYSSEVLAHLFLRRILALLGIGATVRSVADAHERTLAYAEAFPAELPMVYRRLFSLESLTDARLLVGRDDALSAVSAAWARRNTQDRRPLILIASPGVGVTSFLNIAMSGLAEEAPNGIRRVLRERIRDERRLAACLTKYLGVTDTHDLDALADQVLASELGMIPSWVVLEGAEHLQIRAPGGSELFARLVTFMSRTESKIFWIAAVTSSAWQLIEKRSPAFAQNVERVELHPLGSDELRSAILARHRLSGLPLSYAEPPIGLAAIRRRVRWRPGHHAHAWLIEADYFQQLHRASLGSIRLALFHWLRSADFDSVEGSLLVQPLSPLDSGIENLDRTQSFTLKAILDHGTLTVDEYCDVARTAGSESVHILRSLEELRVIERVGDAAGERVSGDSTARSRYRIRPLMIGPVSAHLRSRNILH